MTNKVVIRGALQPGLPDNTNSLESRNNLIKIHLNRARRSVFEQIVLLQEYGRDYAEKEVYDHGISYLPTAFGSARIPTTRHAEDIDDGMCFLGYEAKPRFVRVVTIGSITTKSASRD